METTERRPGAETAHPVKPIGHMAYAARCANRKYLEFGDKAQLTNIEKQAYSDWLAYWDWVRANANAPYPG